MRVGISRASGGGNAALEVFQAAERHGFAGVQAKPSQYEVDGLDAGAFRSRFGGLASLVRAGLVVYPNDRFDEWPTLFAPLIAFASSVGANHLCICCGAGRDNGGDARTRAAAEALTAVGKAAGGAGVSISLHNHADSIFETERDLDALFGLMDGGVCGMTLGTAHAVKGGIDDLGRAVEKYRDALCNVHLKDLDAQGAFCPVGTGTVSLQPVLEALGRMDYQHWLIVDEESRGYSTDDAFRISRAFLQERRIL